MVAVSLQCAKKSGGQLLAQVIVSSYSTYIRLLTRISSLENGGFLNGGTRLEVKILLKRYFPSERIIVEQQCYAVCY